MTDLSAVIPVNLQNAIIRQRKTTDHLLSLTKACSQCAEVLGKTPSLRDVAFDRLSSFLLGHNGVWNPDILFLNTRSESGSLQHSQSLTDALVKAMVDGVSPFEQRVQALYNRHDSTETQYRVSDEDFKIIGSIFAQVMAILLGAYQGVLAQAWDSEEQKPGDEGQRASRHRIVSEYHQLAFEHEVEFEVIVGRLDTDEQKRLLQLISPQPSKGLFKISLPLPDGRKAPLLSVFAVAQADQTIDARNTAGAFHLVMPAGGIERYDSFSDLNSELARRLSMPSSRELVLQNMYLSDCDGLTEDFQIGDDDLIYEPCLEPMLHCHVQALRDKQTQDFDFLVGQARANIDDYPTFLANVGRVQVCAHVDDAMGYRFKSLAVRAQENAQPTWLKHADADKREHYAVLDKMHHERKSVVDKLLGGLESLEVFARAEIGRYVREHMGYSIDPQKIMISLPDEFDIQDGKFSVNYRKSLLEFAMHGLPAFFGEAQLTIPTSGSNPAFTFSFVKVMIDELDLQRRYRHQLRARYNEETTLRAMTHLRDSALGLGAWAALLQGHLIDDRSQELVHLVRGDNVKNGADLSLGSLTLAVSGARFKDVLVFRDRSDDHYVLYAPGAPGGRDMFEFTSWRQLSFEVGSWLGTDAGSHYVMDQTATTSNADPSWFLDEVRRKGTSWGGIHVVFNELEGQNFEERLSGAIRHKVARVLAQDDAATLGLNTETSYANRGTVTLLDQRISELNNAFMRTTKEMVSFKEYARREGSRILNDYIRSEGLSERVDTDTIYIDLKNTAYVANPDFSECTSLISLTRLFMEGYSDDYAYKPAAPMYSSVGQDLRALPLYFVQFVDKALRDAALGERYIRWIQEAFLNPHHNQYAYRRALFGRRLQFEMRRDAILQFLKGDLSEAQYEWLVKLIVSLDKQVLEKNQGLQQRVKRSSVSMFRYASYVVEGVYMFKDFNTSDGNFNLLYTPGAPDGVSFRKVTNYVDLMSSLEMRRYYYLRVPYKGQPSVGSCFDDMDRNKEPQWVNIENREHQNTDRISDIHVLYDAQISRIIADVDEQTESSAERWVAKTYSIVRTLGSVLLIPFPVAAVAWTALHTAIDIQRGLLAYHDGDRATASWFFGSAVFGSIMGGSGAKTIIEGGEGLATTVGWWALGKLAIHTA